ncbi:MAG: PP2C family protein-serine/threonine phosphatase [Bacteroidetes bacterium]|nr:PP2C family protein-serine/threonine phosphatase [Bacteroidota bacterium]
MKSLKKEIAWIAFGLIFSLGIILLYSSNQYDSLKMQIDRDAAIKIATDFLATQDVPTENYYTECYVRANNVNNRYYLNSLGSEKYKNLINSEELPVHGWRVFLHENLFRDEPQTNYIVDLTYSGKLQRFQRTIPDTIDIQTVTQEESRAIAEDFLENTVGFDLADFDLVSSNVASFKNRSDFTFRWETDYQSPQGILVLEATIQGNIPGAFNLEFEPGQATFSQFEITETLLNTLSIVFVFFLTQFAIYFFIKKYHQGEVWLKIGRNIFIVFYLIQFLLLINLWPELGRGVGLGNVNILLTKIVIFVLYALILYLLLSLLVFSSWAVGESYARELWPKKLHGIDAFFKGKFFTLKSGEAVIRGFVFALGLVFLFNITEWLLNSDTNNLFISYNEDLDIFSGIYPAVSVILGSLEKSFLTAIVLGFFVINSSYQKWQKKWLSIIITGLVTMLCGVIAVSPPSLSVLPIDLLLLFTFGCFYAYLFFLFDLLTLFSMLFNVSLLSGALVLYSSDTSFFDYNLVAVAVFILVSPAIYFISLVKRDEFVMESFGMPSHVARISERERLKKEMEIAAKVQLSLLPKENPLLAGYDIAGLSIPAIEAGGDYYDFVKLDRNRIGIAIGDVSGKGVGAAIYMTLTKGILQAHAEENVSPAVVLSKVNKLLYKTIEKNSFVSMYYSILDMENHSINYARAGHNPAIFCSCDGGAPYFLSSKGIALGLEEGEKFNQTLREAEKKLEPGDMIIFYTDGFTEAMNENLQQFGEQRLLDLIESNKRKTANELVDTIVKNVNKFIDVFPQHDDMTIVVVKRT